MKPRWKRLRQVLANRRNGDVARARHPRERWMEWGRLGGGRTWQQRYRVTKE